MSNPGAAGARARVLQEDRGMGSVPREDRGMRSAPREDSVMGSARPEDRGLNIGFRLWTRCEITSKFELVATSAFERKCCVVLGWGLKLSLPKKGKEAGQRDTARAV